MPDIAEVLVPANEEGTRATILRWCKAVGDTVAKDEALVELETDKVTVEVPSPAHGTLIEILKQVDVEVSPDEVLARLRLTEADRAAAQPSAAAATRRLRRRRRGGAAPADRGVSRTGDHRCTERVESRGAAAASRACARSIGHRRQRTPGAHHGRRRRASRRRCGIPSPPIQPPGRRGARIRPCAAASPSTWCAASRPHRTSRRCSKRI